jgi:hypothetical protein
VLTNRRVKERVEQRCEVWGRNITSQTNMDRALAEIRLQDPNRRIDLPYGTPLK